jgi:hypothetical protein
MSLEFGISARSLPTYCSRSSMWRPWRRSNTTCAIELLTGWNLGCRTISTVFHFKGLRKSPGSFLRTPLQPLSAPLGYQGAGAAQFADTTPHVCSMLHSSRPREGCNARCEKGTSTSTNVLQHWLSGRLGTTATANGHQCRYQIFRTIRQYRNSMPCEGEASPDSPLETR